MSESRAWRRTIAMILIVAAGVIPPLVPTDTRAAGFGEVDQLHMITASTGWGWG